LKSLCYDARSEKHQNISLTDRVLKFTGFNSPETVTDAL